MGTTSRTCCPCSSGNKKGTKTYQMNTSSDYSENKPSTQKLNLY